MEDAVDHLPDKLEARVVHVTQEALAEIMKTLNTGHNQSFVEGAFRRTTRDMMANMLDDANAREAFESNIIRVATSGSSARAIANMAVKGKRFLVPAAKFVAKQAEKKVSRLRSSHYQLLLRHHFHRLVAHLHQTKNGSSRDAESRPNI